MKDSQQMMRVRVRQLKYIKANNERFSTIGENCGESV